MLTIRRDQLEVLARPLRRKFAADVGADLRERYPGKAAELSGEGASRLVERAFALGKRYGIDAFADVAVLAELLLVRGDGFDRAAEPPELTEVLDHPKIPGSGKAAWLRKTLLEGGADAEEE